MDKFNKGIMANLLKIGLDKPLNGVVVFMDTPHSELTGRRYLEEMFRQKLLKKTFVNRRSKSYLTSAKGKQWLEKFEKENEQ